MSYRMRELLKSFKYFTYSIDNKWYFMDEEFKFTSESFPSEIEAQKAAINQVFKTKKDILAYSRKKSIVGEFV